MLSHVGRLAPTPHNLPGSTPHVLAGVTPVSPSTEALAPGTPYEGYIRWIGHLGHPTRTEASACAPDRTLSSSFLPSSLAEVPQQLSGDSSSSHREPVVDVVVPQTPTPTPQDSVSVTSLLAPAPSNPTGALRTGGMHGPVPIFKGGFGPAIQTRPKPRVKACLLCAGGRDLPVLQDAGLVMQGLDGVRNLESDNVITRTSKMIDVAFDRFFDPTDIRKGGLLILIISGHGKRGFGEGVSLEFQTQDGTLVNSSMLQQKIMALPKHCTLEVIMDTCFAEDVIPGLRPILTLESSATSTLPTRSPNSVATYTPPSESCLNTRAPVSPAALGAGPSIPPAVGLLKQYFPPLEQDGRPKYEADVVVWAASAKWGSSYPEADLPGKPGVHSIMIGAIFNHLSSNGPNTRRRGVWENVLAAVEKQNDARRERDLRKPPEVRATLIGENRIQRPILLTSVEDPDDVLNGLVFRPIRKGRRTLVDLD